MDPLQDWLDAPQSAFMNAKRARMNAALAQQQSMHAALSQQKQIAINQIYGMMSASNGVTSGLEAPITKDQLYEMKLHELEVRVKHRVDAVLAVLTVASILIFAMVAFLGVRDTVITVTSIGGVIGLYFGIHGAVFAYRKRQFDIEQATKAMLE